MNRVKIFAIHRCINEGYGLIQVFTEKIRISPTKLWHVCIMFIQCVDYSYKIGVYMCPGVVRAYNFINRHRSVEFCTG